MVLKLAGTSVREPNESIYSPFRDTVTSHRQLEISHGGTIVLTGVGTCYRLVFLFVCLLFVFACYTLVSAHLVIAFLSFFLCFTHSITNFSRNITMQALPPGI